MKLLPLVLLPLLASCERTSTNTDTEQLLEMIEVRVQAMSDKDIGAAMLQFDEDATWINSQGYFFEGKQNILEFHQMLAGRNALDYNYDAGEPRVRILDASNALVYYSWKMFWYDRDSPKKIVNREIGLMTLSAVKRDGHWRWVAVTNQHTPWFYDAVENVTIDDDE